MRIENRAGWTAAVFAACVALSGVAKAQEAGAFGAGVIVGRPIGFTGKTWLSHAAAVDFGAGFASGDPVLYADVLGNVWLQPASGKLALYFGGGPRLQLETHYYDDGRFDRHHDGVFGIRAVAGLEYWIAREPVALFMEGGPVFNLSRYHDYVNMDLGLGARYYFGK